MWFHLREREREREREHDAGLYALTLCMCVCVFMSWVTVILCWLSLKLIQCFVACIHFLCTLMQFGMCLAVDYTTTHPKLPSWKKRACDGVLRFLVDSRSNVLRYQRPLHPCKFSHCENTAPSYRNRPFPSASKLAAVLNIAQRYRLKDTTKRSEPCLSSNMSAMRAHHSGRSDEEGSIGLQSTFTSLAANSREII